MFGSTKKFTMTMKTRLSFVFFWFVNFWMSMSLLYTGLMSFFRTMSEAVAVTTEVYVELSSINAKKWNKNVIYSR